MIDSGLLTVVCLAGEVAVSCPVLVPARISVHGVSVPITCSQSAPKVRGTNAKARYQWFW